MMQKLPLLLMCLSFVALVGLGSAFAGQEKGVGGTSPRKAILLVAFGTTVPEAMKAYEPVEARVREAFPGVDVRWAYTSKTVRARLAAQGKALASPEVALAQLMSDGYTQVALLSLHIIPGEEFHDLFRNAELFGRMSGGLERVAVAKPLLSSHEDMVRVLAALIHRFPASRKPEDAILLMGHGSKRHPSDATYSALNYLLADSAPNVFMATVDGYPTVNDLLPKLTASKAKKVYLLPFMTVAGVHAREDMVGDSPESWESVLKRQGFQCEGIFTGLIEYPEVVDVWIDHLREAFARL